MKTDGCLATAGWFTSVVAPVLEMNIVNGENTESCAGVSRTQHLSQNFDSVSRVNEARIMNVP